MKTVFPNYYKNFKCIADKCKHSCCIGWEIDIDDDTLCYYNTLDGEIAKRLNASISYEEEPHFILRDGERCPFLNKSGLCDIITELGEDALCNICADHPRFRSFYSDCVELGLGLCCGAAAELILKSDEPFELENFDLSDDVYSDEERKILELRSELIDIMKDRSCSIEQRHNKLLLRLNCSMPTKSLPDWCDFYLELERLDPLWTVLLTNLKVSSLKDFYANIEEKTEIELEQLTIYFLYRYISSVLSSEELRQILCFSIMSTRIIMALVLSCQGGGDYVGDIAEYARMYSSEIEYSDINVIKLCQQFK